MSVSGGESRPAEELGVRLADDRDMREWMSLPEPPKEE
jgi:hypothetical protein